MITVTAFRSVPDFAKGLVRDLRVRWALEEAGRPYAVKLLGQGEQSDATNRALQPFGQVPAITDGDLVLFESGAIVLHIARDCERLLPTGPVAAARTQAWLIAALNTVEPVIGSLVDVDLFFADQAWARAARPTYEAAVKARLADLAAFMTGRDYLEAGRFTAADLVMTTVLQILRDTDLVARQPVLEAYVGRCTARPAYRRALEAQLADFADAPPAGP